MVSSFTYTQVLGEIVLAWHDASRSSCNGCEYGQACQESTEGSRNFSKSNLYRKANT